MFIRKNKIIIILQPVDGATDGATRRVICPASYDTVNSKTQGWLRDGDLRDIASREVVVRQHPHEWSRESVRAFALSDL